MYTTLWATFLVAFVLSLAMTPAAIKLAPKIGAMDVPKDDRRMHVKAMPRFGGMAIFIGTMVSTAIFLLQLDHRILGIMIGGVLIYLLGVIDDLKNLPAKVKFLGQTVIAIIMYLYDIALNLSAIFLATARVSWERAVLPCNNSVDCGHHQYGQSHRRFGRFGGRHFSDRFAVYRLCRLYSRDVSGFRRDARVGRAARSGSCRITSIRRKFSWATEDRCSWDLCFPPCQFWGRSKARPSWR